MSEGKGKPDRESRGKRLVKRHLQGKHKGWQGDKTSCPTCMSDRRFNMEATMIMALAKAESGAES